MRPDLFPTKLPIGKSEWKIIYSDFHPDQNLDDLGMCFSDKVIWVSTKQCDVSKFATLLHEIMHAIDFEYGIKIPHRVIEELDAPLAKAILILLRGAY